MRDTFYTASRWFLFLVIVCLAFYLFYAQIYLVYGPKVADVDARLPTVFHSSAAIFWSWFVGLAVLAGGLGYWSFRSFRALRGGPGAAASEPDEDDLALASACEAIANLRRGHEREPAYLMIAEGDAPVALLNAADLGPDAVVPPDDRALIRGLRTPDGMFIQCAGPDIKGVQAACRVLATAAGSPPLRGIVVQVPVALLLGPKAHGFAHAGRAMLRAAAEAGATRCPAYVVVSGMEDVPGFLEFARRGPAEYRASARFGFALTWGDDSSPQSVAREYDRLVGWYDLAALDFMEAGPLQQEGNEALFCLGRWFIQVRGPLLHFLEATKPEGDDPLELLNCYFAATGDDPDRRAFAASLMRVKVAGDARSTRWSLRSLRADEALKRAAIGLGAVGGGIILLAWAAIFAYLRPRGWIDGFIALIIAAGWGAGWYELLRGFRRPRGRAPGVNPGRGAPPAG